MRNNAYGCSCDGSNWMAHDFEGSDRSPPTSSIFCCHESRLIVELDGGQHAENAAKDLARTQELEALGFHVLRFWNNEVFENIEGVLERIRENLLAR